MYIWKTICTFTIYVIMHCKCAKISLFNQELYKNNLKYIKDMIFKH